MKKLQAIIKTTAQLKHNYWLSLIAFLLFLTLFLSCSSPSKLSSWTDPNKSFRTPSKILIVGIVHDSLLDLRRNVEDYFVTALRSTGYNAESSLGAFGNKGLSRFDQEETYIRLCSQGIDAVLTIALLQEKQANTSHGGSTPKNTSSYYFNRIINYKSIRKSTPESVKAPSGQTQLVWEAILFNLSTLTPLYWAQTQPFPLATTRQSHNTYNRIILNNIMKQKILGKRPLVKLYTILDKY